MKKILQFTFLFFAVIITPLSSLAQLYSKHFPQQKPDENFKHVITVGASYDLNSTAMTNSLYNKYLYSNYIDEETKNTVLPNLNENNRFGAYAEQFIRYDFKAKKAENTWFNIEVKNRRHYGISFTDDAYELLLYGNSRFAGKEAVLDNSNLLRINYQTIGFGVNKINIEKKISYGINVGFSHGTRITDVKINKGRVFTSFAGDSIAAVADLSARYANLRGVEERTAGIGGAISANFSYYPTEKSYFTLSVTDLGFLHFYRTEARKFEMNQTISYRGYEANDFGQSFTPDKFEALPDKISKEVDSAEVDEAFTVWQPAQMHFFYNQYMGKKTRAVLGVEYFMASYHLPSVHINVLQEVTPWLSLMGGVNVLGYGKYGINAAASVNVKNISVLVGTDHAEAPFAPKNTFGQGGYINLSYRL